MGERELVGLLCLSSLCLMVDVALPRDALGDAMGLSAVCGCGIS